MPATDYARYLAAIVEHFGNSIDRWGKIEIFEGYQRLRVRVHGEVDFLALPHAGGGFELRRGARMSRQRILDAGEVAGVAASEDELKLLALELAPPRAAPGVDLRELVRAEEAWRRATAGVASPNRVTRVTAA